MSLKRKSSLVAAASLMGLFTLFSGVSTSAFAATHKSAKQHYTFELITKSNASPYWLAVKDGADAAAAKMGVTVNFEAPVSGTDLATQISMVQNAVAAHVNGIILAAQNPQALLAPVKSAMKAGVPVVTVDSGVTPNVSDSFAATSNTASSANLAKYVAAKVHGHGAYAIIDFNEEASTGILRPAGFRKGMAAFPGMKYIGMQLSNNNIATATSEAEAFIESHPNINVMFGANDRSALGVAAAVQQMHKVGKIIVAGFDADLGEVALIKSGVISAAVLQSPYAMGYDAVMNLIKIKSGQKVPKRIATPYMLVTPQNVNTPEAVQMIQQYIPTYHR
ncbi:MAG: sugar ABC transporter substrate-binding protein [Bacilli bacterium]